MKKIGSMLIIVMSLIFELAGRLLSQVASWLMSIAVMLLSAISGKE